MKVGGSACLEDEMMNRLYAWLFLGYDLATTWLRLGDRDGVFTVCLDELHMQYSILLSASPSRYPGMEVLVCCDIDIGATLPQYFTSVRDEGTYS